MSWGMKTMLVFGLFVAGMLFMVFKSAKQDMDLVAPDYYEQELKYQEVIDAAQHANALEGRVICKVKEGFIEVSFPAEMVGKEMQGQVWLYCIADKKRDLKENMATKEGVFRIPIESKHAGLYEVKVNWMAEGVTYYHEEKLFIQ